MAIQFNGDRNVAQHHLNPEVVAQHVAKARDAFGYSPALKSAEPQGARPVEYVSKTEFDALKAEVASLRELIARQAVAPAKKSRAEYYREYRKRLKTDGQLT